MRISISRVLLVKMAAVDLLAQLDPEVSLVTLDSLALKDLLYVEFDMSQCYKVVAANVIRFYFNISASISRVSLANLERRDLSVLPV